MTLLKAAQLRFMLLVAATWNVRPAREDGTGADAEPMTRPIRSPGFSQPTLNCEVSEMCPTPASAADWVGALSSFATAAVAGLLAVRELPRWRQQRAAETADLIARDILLAVHNFKDVTTTAVGAAQKEFICKFPNEVGLGPMEVFPRRDVEELVLAQDAAYGDLLRALYLGVVRWPGELDEGMRRLHEGRMLYLNELFRIITAIRTGTPENVADVSSSMREYIQHSPSNVIINPAVRQLHESLDPIPEVVKKKLIQHNGL